MNKQKLQELKELRKDIRDIVGDLIDILLEDETPHKAPETTPTKSPKFFIPKNDEAYYFFDDYGDICSRRFSQYPEQGEEKRISTGVYRTYEEAEKAFEKQEAFVRLWTNADSKYFFRPDWGNGDQVKFSMYFDSKYKQFRITASRCAQENFSLPHFATREDTENFIKENEVDLKIYCLD